jgi:GT2 family glycosyltransferase
MRALPRVCGLRRTPQTAGSIGVDRWELEGMTNKNLGAEFAFDTARDDARPAAPSPIRFVSGGQAADLDVILVNYNTGHLLERCIDSLRRAACGLSVHVVVVDNASRDDSLDIIRQRLPDCTLIANTLNVGFGRANNQALAICGAPYVLLLNTDAFVSTDTLVRSLAYMQAKQQIGVLGATLLDEHGRGGNAGRVFPSPWHSFLLQTGLFKRFLREEDAVLAAREKSGVRECDWVVGCYYLIRRSVIDQVGLFDPRYFLYFEEVDHCRAVWKAGWTIECLTTTGVVHIGGASARSEGELNVGRQIPELQIESGLLYYRKHDGLPGVLLSAGLAFLTDLILIVKHLAKRRPLAGLGVFARHSAAVGRLMMQTRLGTRPTR